MQTYSKTLSTFFILLIFCSFGNYAEAQDKRSGEIGAFIGGSYYLGEINKIPFIGTRPAMGALYRHTFDTRFAITGNFTYGKLTGSDSKSNSEYQKWRGKEFNSSFYELSATGEFNFIPFLPGKKKKYSYTPYIFVGVSEMYYRRDDVLYKFIFSIPFGGGIKYNINSNYIFGAFIGMRKIFFDYLDYKYSTLTPETVTTEKKQIGYAGNDDWYSVFGVSLTYKIKYRAKCPAFD